MSEEKEEEKKVSKAAASGGGGKLLIIISAVNLVISGGTIGFLYTHLQAQKKAVLEDIADGEHGGGGETGGGGEHGGGEQGGGSGSKKTEHSFGKMVRLEEFTINLATLGSVRPQFARIKITLEVPNSDIEDEVTQKMPKVRNAVIDLINSKAPKDLATVEGRDHVKEEIKNALNAFLVTGKVAEVLFTNFALSS